MAYMGLPVPVNALEKAIFIPRDLEPEGRKYPKVEDQLMKLKINFRKNNIKRSSTTNGRKR